MSFASLHPLFIQLSHYLSVAAPWTGAVGALFGVIALLYAVSLRRRFKRLALGRNGSIEESIAILTREMKDAKVFRSEIEKYLKLSESRLRGSVQGVGLIRFNPFNAEGQGGNQSFSLALLDERGSGVVFSTLYARDRVGVYAKPLEAGKSTYELSAEEKTAIQKAEQSIAQHKKSA